MGGGGRTALVLSGGGARAAYQVGVIRHIGRRCPDRRFRILTGVSAGAINATYLASHTGGLGGGAEGLAERWRSLTMDNVFRYDPLTISGIAARWALALGTGGTKLAPEARSLVNTRPLRSFLDRAMDMRGIARNIREGRLWAVAISATSYHTGRTVSFIQGSDEVELWDRPQRTAVRDELTVDHVMASSALPLLFPAVPLDGGWYGDGSIRQAAPLAPGIHLGADRILSVSARYERSVAEAEVPVMDEYPPPAQVLGLLFNNIFLDALDADASRLERINGLLEACGDGRAEELRQVGLHLVRPSEDLGQIATEYREELPAMVRYLVGGLEADDSRTSDFLSYLLFEPSYLARLIELGEADAERQWPEISSFLGWGG